MILEQASILIYQSKSYGSIRRASNTMADGFSLDDGVLNLSGGFIDFVGKKISPTHIIGTDQTKLLGSASANSQFSTFSPNLAFDGNSSTDWVCNEYSNNQSNLSNLVWDFGSGQAKEIVSCLIKQSYRTSSAPFTLPIGSIKLSYSDNLTSWTDFKIFTLFSDNSMQTLNWNSVGSHRAWKITASSNTATNGYAWGISESQLLDKGSYSNINLISKLQASLTSINTVDLVLEYSQNDSISLNTDIIASLTCDGLTYIPATLVLTTGQNGRVLASANGIICPSGVNFGYSINSNNNKNFDIFGIAINAY